MNLHFILTYPYTPVSIYGTIRQNPSILEECVHHFIWGEINVKKIEFSTGVC